MASSYEKSAPYLCKLGWKIRKFLTPPMEKVCHWLEVKHRPDPNPLSSAADANKLGHGIYLFVNKIFGCQRNVENKRNSYCTEQTGFLSTINARNCGKMFVWHRIAFKKCCLLHNEPITWLHCLSLGGRKWRRSKRFVLIWCHWYALMRSLFSVEMHSLVCLRFFRQCSNTKSYLNLSTLPEKSSFVSVSVQKSSDRSILVFVHMSRSKSWSIAQYPVVQLSSFNTMDKCLLSASTCFPFRAIGHEEKYFDNVFFHAAAMNLLNMPKKHYGFRVLKRE